MIELPNKDVNLPRLVEEVAALNLPEFRGIARLQRRQNAEGIWEPSERYLLVKVGQLTQQQQTQLRSVVATHVNQPEKANEDAIQKSAQSKLVALGLTLDEVDALRN